jgi:hypothetical protein
LEVRNRLEFEAKITSFSTCLVLLASYGILFSFWGYAQFFLVIAMSLLLLVAFRDFTSRQFIGIHLVFVALTIGTFLGFSVDPQYVPLVVVLIVSLIAFKTKLEAFLPSLLGLLGLFSFQYVNTDFLVKGIGFFSANLASLIGVKCTMDDLGYIHVYFSRTRMPILVDEAKILLPLYMSILIGQLVLVGLLDTSKRSVLKHAFLAVFLTFAMPIITLTYSIQSPSAGFFIPEGWWALSFPLTLTILLSSLTPSAKIACIEAKIPSLTIFSLIKEKLLTLCARARAVDRILKNLAKSATGAFVVVVIAFFLLSLLYYTPHETRHDPIIIIDESHSEWEPTWPDYLETYEKDPISGTNNYFGLLSILSSIYDCTLLVDKLEKKPAVGSVRTVLAEEITFQTLERIVGDRKGVLILKCVTKEYSEPEIDAILRFVANGNGLILISEHTDVYGTGTHLNSIAERLGYRFLPSAIRDFYSETRGMMTPKSEFPISISRFLTGDYVWETGCSLEKLTSSSASQFEVRSHISCFAQWRNETAAFYLTRQITEEVKLNSQFQWHLIFSALKYGDGRVILMTDSTCFNNGVIGFGEHAQFFVGMTEYTAREADFDKSIIPFLMLATASVLIILNRRKVLRMTILLIALILISSSLARPLAPYTIQFPKLKTEPRAIAIQMPEDYYEDYLSGALDVSEIMDKYFRQNLTAIFFPGPPPSEWLEICARTEKFNGILYPSGP